MLFMTFYSLCLAYIPYNLITTTHLFKEEEIKVNIESQWTAVQW